MNENEIRREQKVTRKLLQFLDKRLEEIISNERLTGADEKSTPAGTQNDETFLALSKERRALLRSLRTQLASESDSE